MIQTDLPRKVDFYHLGTIEARQTRADTGELEGDAIYIAVSIRPVDADARLILLSAFSEGFVEALGPGVHSSVCMEFANVIASRVADGLSRTRESGGIMITPPDRIGREAAERLARSMKQLDRKDYGRGGAAPVRVWILSAQEEAGNV